MPVKENINPCVTRRYSSLEMSSDSENGSIFEEESRSDGSSSQPARSLEVQNPGVEKRLRERLANRCLPSNFYVRRRSPGNSLLKQIGEYDEKASDHRGRRSSIIPRRSNRVLLHIYDLIASDTLIQLPWGCVCEIGKCFNDVNSALHEMGTGAYHVGVECNGIEYAYGACSQRGKSGVFSCIPMLSPGYQYRTSIDFGEVILKRTSWVVVPNDEGSSPRSVASNSFRQVEEFIDGRTVMKEMASEYMGVDYNILRRNCCTFAADACVRLGVPKDKVPTWFRNLAETGAYSQDMANAAFVEPLQKVLSTAAHDDSLCGDDCSSVFDFADDEEEMGFELIAERNATNTRDVVVVIHAEPKRPSFRRTVSPAY